MSIQYVIRFPFPSEMLPGDSSSSSSDGGGGGGEGGVVELEEEEVQLEILKVKGTVEK